MPLSFEQFTKQTIIADTSRSPQNAPEEVHSQSSIPAPQKDVDGLVEGIDYKMSRAYFHKKSGLWVRHKIALDGGKVQSPLPDKKRDDTPKQIAECECEKSTNVGMPSFSQYYNANGQRSLYPTGDFPEKLHEPTFHPEHVAPEDLEGTELTMDDVHDIHKEIDNTPIDDLMMKWEILFSEPEEDESMDEGLDAGQRLKAKTRFNRTSKSRNTKKALVMARPADNNRLQNRAQNMARRMVMAKMLRGRSKSTLSPSEKTNLEQRLKSASGLIRKIAVRVFPKVKSIDRNRLIHRT